MSLRGIVTQASLSWSGSADTEREAREGYAAERARIRKRKWILRRREKERLAAEAKSWRERRSYWKHLRARQEGER